MPSTESLSASILSSADDILRGLFRTSEYGRVILPLVLMRRLDCVLEPKKDEVLNLYKEYKDELEDPSSIIKRQVDLPFINVSKFDLSRIKSDQAKVLFNFSNYIHGYSKNVLEIIDGFSLTPLIEKLNKNNRLYLLIDKFTEFDLHPSKVDNRLMGEIFEHLITVFAQRDEYGESSSNYTPREIINLMIKTVFINTQFPNKDDSIKKRSLYDGCAGTGGLLTSAHKELNDNKLNQKLDFFAQELNTYSHALCKANLLINGLDVENIILGDSLTSGIIKKKDFDYLVSVPPFGLNWVSQKELIEKGSLGDFAPGLPRKSDSSFLFLLDQVSKMKPKAEGGSRSSILLYKGPMSHGGINSGENKIREYLIKEDLIESIIALPENLFYHTSIPTFIWNLSNNKPLHLKNKICFIDARSCIIENDENNMIGSKKEVMTNHYIENIQDSYKDLYSDGVIENINFKLIDSKRLLQKEVSISAENDKFLNPGLKKIKTLISSKQEINNLYKRHPWLGKEFETVISEENFVQLNILESFNKIAIHNKISNIETEYKNYKKINLGQIILDINLFHRSSTTKDIPNDKIFKNHSDAIYMFFSGSKHEITFNKNFDYEKKFLSCAQIILKENLVNKYYLIQYFNSSFGQATLSNLMQNHSGFRVRKLITDPLIISDIEIPLPDISTQQEILDVKELPQRLINTLTMMSKEININPTSSPIIRKRLLEMIRITEELTIEDHIKELIRNGENKKLEFKETFSLNMHTLKKDQIIVHQVLKNICAFLNSDGGILLIGVTDNGLCKGCNNEIIKLHNNSEDNLLKKIKDSIRDHIGLEYSEFYKVNSIHLDRNILLVKIDCKRSNIPCFIGDDFYVRTNPGTDKLAGRKLIEYEKVRFHDPSSSK